MDKEAKFRELTELFRKAGCSESESWARSEVDDDIPQLSRFLVLKMMLRTVLEEGSGEKMARQWREARPTSLTHYDRGLDAAHRLLDQGSDPNDLVDLIRAEQITLIFNICYGLDDPQHSDEFEQYECSLVDPEGRLVQALYESVNEVCAELCFDPLHRHK